MDLEKRIYDKFNNIYNSTYLDFPKKNLLIEITNLCNNKCIFCYNQFMKREKKFIDPEFCIKILNDAYDLGCKEVGFYVTGEPLLNKDIFKYIEYAKKIGYKYIYITTNGVLADLKTVKKLYGSGLNSIKYSINAINKEDYKYIHGTNYYSRVIDNLTKVYQWKKEENIDLNIYVSYIATKYTCNIQEVRNFFKNLCDECIILNAINQGGLIPDIKDNLSANKMLDFNNKFKLPCSYPFNSVVITVEGFLTACCMDFENLLAYEDLNEVSLKEAWNNDYIRDLRNKHLTNNIHGCICDNCINNSYEIPNPLNKKLCKLKRYDVFPDHLIKEDGEC